MSNEANATLDNLVRVGLVSSVDSSNRLARVFFPDKEIVSGPLHVLKHVPMPSVNDMVLCLYRPVFNGDGYVIGVIV